MTVLRVNTIAGIGTTTFGPTFGGNLEFNSQNYIVLPKGSSTQQGVLRETVDVVGTGGTFYDNLVLAMPFNEATGLRDVSSRNRNPGIGLTGSSSSSAVGIATTVSKYYGSSAQFLGGHNAFLKFADEEDFTLGTKDFTLEAWVRTNVVDGFRFIAGQADSSGSVGSRSFRMGITSPSNKFEGMVSNGSSNFQVLSTNAVTVDTWNHLAFVRDGGTIRLYVDGTQQTSTNIGIGTTITNSTNQFAIGQQGEWTDSNAWNGFMQDFRFYNGICKYPNGTTFTPPDRIAEVGVGFTTGQLRYNTDSNLPELYDGNQWVQLSVSQVGLGTGGDTEPGARGVFGSGTTPQNANIIDYINISSTGNAVTFGNLVSQIQGASANASSSTRGIWAGGQNPIGSEIQFITISSTGNSQSFGSLTQSRRFAGGVSNQTRGVFGGGSTPVQQNTIDYITISSTGNAVDFGDLSSSRMQANGLGSSTRGIFTGGNLSPTPGFTNILEYITISTLGNVTDFGDMTISDSDLGTCSNPIRGIMVGGSPAGNAKQNTIQFITIATLGNAVNFGGLVVGSSALGGVASPTRAVFAGGYTNPGTTMTNRIEYVTIMTAGNSVDFGDLTTARDQLTGCSNAHGGL